MGTNSGGGTKDKGQALYSSRDVWLATINSSIEYDYGMIPNGI